MFGMMETIYGFIRRQVGLRTDAASSNGSLHAKLAHIVETFTDRVSYASDTLRVSADTERSYMGETYAKLKEIVSNMTGTMRVSFDLKNSSDSGPPIRARIYVNGVAVGLERFSYSTTYTTYTEDITIRQGDLIQIYAQGTSTQYAIVQNFRVFYDVRNTPIVSID
jgi:hypothetical protein